MVTPMVKSRGLTISGSGAVSTRRAVTPCQGSARISRSPSSGVRGGGIGVGPSQGRRRDLAGFQELLQPAQVVVGLLARLLAPQLGEQAARLPGRRLVGDGGPHLRPTVARGAQELH